MSGRDAPPAARRTSAAEYHLRELSIALDPTHASHALPPLTQRHGRVLDVGCGAGQSLVACGLAAAGAPAVGIGIDVDEDAVALGRASWPGLGLAVARGEALPFADASFDLVYSRVAIPYMRVAAAARDFRRVLRPGGDLWLLLHPFRMAVADLRAAVRHRAPRAVAHRVYVLANGLLLHAAGITVPFPFGRRATESWQSGRGMRLVLRRAGFAAVETRSVGAALLVTARVPTAP